MDNTVNPSYDWVFFLAGVATTGIFIFLERTGMLKQRWVLAGIGIFSVVLYGIAGWIYIPANWHWVIYHLVLVGIIWVLYVVSERIKKIMGGIRLHWPITFGEQRAKSIQQNQPTEEVLTEINKEVDALDHFIIEHNLSLDLSILKAYMPLQFTYPILIRNTRPISIEIVSFNVNIYWEYSPIQNIKWDLQSQNASNALQVSAIPIVIAPDSCRRFEVPVNIQQISNLSEVSPRWHCDGSISIRCGEHTQIKGFDCKTDNYHLSVEDWEALKQNIKLQNINQPQLIIEDIVETSDRISDYNCGLLIKNQSNSVADNCEGQLIAISHITFNDSSIDQKLPQSKFSPLQWQGEPIGTSKITMKYTSLIRQAKNSGKIMLYL